jgi:hypothetical protein
VICRVWYLRLAAILPTNLSALFPYFLLAGPALAVELGKCPPPLVPKPNFGDLEASCNKVPVQMQHKFESFMSEITVASGYQI